MMNYWNGTRRTALETIVLRSGDGSSSYPAGLGLAPNGELIIANSLGHRVCRLSAGGSLEPIAGGGRAGFRDAEGMQAQFHNPKAVAISGDGTIFVADCDNHAIRTIVPGTGTVTTFVGHGEAGFEDGKAQQAGLRSPRGLALDDDGNLHVAMMQAIRRVTPDAMVTTIARNGWTPAGCAETTLGFLGGIAIDPRYGILVTDTTYHAIWQVDGTGGVRRLAGGNGAGRIDGPWEEASFCGPRGIVVDKLGRILVADSKNDALRVLHPSGSTETIFGEDLDISDGFDLPAGLAIGADGSVYLADQLNNRVHRIAL